MGCLHRTWSRLWFLSKHCSWSVCTENAYVCDFFENMVHGVFEQNMHTFTNSLRTLFMGRLHRTWSRLWFLWEHCLWRVCMEHAYVYDFFENSVRGVFAQNMLTSTISLRTLFMDCLHRTCIRLRFLWEHCLWSVCTEHAYVYDFFDNIVHWVFARNMHTSTISLRTLFMECLHGTCTRLRFLWEHCSWSVRTAHAYVLSLIYGPCINVRRELPT